MCLSVTVYPVLRTSIRATGLIRTKLNSLLPENLSALLNVKVILVAYLRYAMRTLLLLCCEC